MRPEWLDELPPGDPRALHSRRDLRRINRLMGNAALMAPYILDARRMSDASDPAAHSRMQPSRPLFLVELGGGDGTFLLDLARRTSPAVGPVHAILVDRQSLMTPATRRALAGWSWEVEAVAADVFAWLTRRDRVTADVMLANLFLHHFERERLAALLSQTADQTRMFVACEPRRYGAALAAASLMRLIGCNDVTLHDGRISVRAGFRGAELSAIWPHNGGWAVHERAAGLFSQLFVARREFA